MKKFATLSTADMVARRQGVRDEKRSEVARQRAEQVKRRREESAAAIEREQRALDKLNVHPPRGIKGALGVSRFIRSIVLEVR